jgi:hypothetical protein
MLRKLAKIATKLDQNGLTKEADILDQFIRKLAIDGDNDFVDTEGSGSFEEEKEGLPDISGLDHESEPDHESESCQKCWQDGFEAGRMNSSAGEYEEEDEDFDNEEVPF